MDKRFSSIIFDWDGTLAMTLHLWLAGYRHELKKLDCNLSDQIIADDFFYEHDKAAMKYPAVDFGPFNERVRAHVLSHVQQLQTVQSVPIGHRDLALFSREKPCEVS